MMSADKLAGTDLKKGQSMRRKRTRYRDAEIEKKKLSDMKQAVSGGWATSSELWSWYLLDFADSGWGAVCLALFMPLMLIYLAEETACPYDAYAVHRNTSTTCQYTGLSNASQEVSQPYDQWRAWTSTVLGEYGLDTEQLHDGNVDCGGNLPVWWQGESPETFHAFRNTTINTTALEEAFGNTKEWTVNISRSALPSFNVSSTSPEMLVLSFEETPRSLRGDMPPNVAQVQITANVFMEGLGLNPKDEAVNATADAGGLVDINDRVWPYGSSTISLTAAEEEFSFTILVNKTRSCYGKVTWMGIDMRPNTFASIVLSCSVFFQIFFFISFASMGDHGNHRRDLMLACTYIGGLSAASFLPLLGYVAPRHARYAWCGWLCILVNVMNGLATIMYNAFLPYLTLAHPEMQKLTSTCKDTDKILAKFVTLEDEVSHKGSAVGYLGSFLSLIICVIIVFVLPGFLDGFDPNDKRDFALYAVFAFCGIWWIVFSIPGQIHIQSRPGPPLPESYTKWGVLGWIAYGWQDSWLTLKNLPTLKNTSRYLIAFYIYSDTYSTVSTVGIMFAKHEFNASLNFLVILSLLSPIFSIAGNMSQMKIEQSGLCASWSQKNWILLNLGIYTFLFSYGMIGFIPGAPFGLVNINELIILTGLHGFALGSVQSYSRTLLSELTPPGLESEFFGIFELTDKGSSWIGPFVVAMIYETTGSMRLAFPYCIIMIVGAMLFLYFCVDVEEGIKECRSLKTMMWVRARRKHKKVDKKKLKARKAKEAGMTSSMVGSSTNSSVVSSGIVTHMEKENAKKNQVVPS